MSDGLIVWQEIPVPKVKPEDLRTAADALEDDGDDISQAGQDIKMSWQGLEGIYAAPESEVLFSAINPVATKGDDVDYALGITVRALRTFANDAERLKAKLQGLKADAKAFVEEVKGDDDWREDEDKVNEHNTLNNDILAALHEYQEAERTCANTITAQFNGTTFVPADSGDKQMLNKGEKAYGTAEALEGVETPWATPQNHDGAWYEDVYDGVKDSVVGALEGLGSMTGFYDGEDWGVDSWDEWSDNLYENWEGTVKGLGTLSGFYGEDGLGVDSFGEWWGNFSSGWKEFAHAFVPWREWDDRPGYVLTQGVINIGSIFLGGSGAVKALEKASRKIGNGEGSDGSNGDSNGNGAEEPPIHVGPSTSDIRQRLDRPQLDQSQINGIDDSLDRLQSLVTNRATPVGGGDGGSGGNNGRPDGDGDEVGDQGDPDRGRPSTPEQRDRQEPPGSDRDGQDDPSGGRDRPDRPNDDQTSPLPDPKNTPEDSQQPSEPRGEAPAEDNPGQQEQPGDREDPGAPEQKDDGDQTDPDQRGDPDTPEGEDQDTPETPAERESPPEHEPDPDSDSPEPLPPDSKAGRILEEIGESRLHRGDDGLIDEIDGRPVNSYIRDLVTDRANYMNELVKDGLVSKKSLGDTSGAVNAVAFDRRSGVLVEAINGRRSDVIPADDLHPLLRSRLEDMRDGGPYPLHNRSTRETMQDMEFPHNDNPLRHAEVKALNELLKMRGPDAGPEVLSDVQIDTAFTLYKTGPTPAPCCANCTRMIDGSGTNTDRLRYPPGHPESDGTRTKGDM